MQEADYGQTAMAFGGASARYANDDQLLVRFYMHPKQDKAASVEEGRPIYKEVPYIHIMQPGNKESIIHRVATKMDKDRFVEHFRKFEAREDQDVISGTPIVEWPGVSRAQAEELKFFNVMSVEQLAGMSDTNTQNFRGMGELKRRAQAFLSMAKENAGAEALAIATKRNGELEATIADLAERLAALESDNFDTEPVPDFDLSPLADVKKPKSSARRRKKVA